MRLFESIIDANHRAVSGDNSVGLHPADFADELPVIALTCIDPRLNALFPDVLGIPAEKFIWLRNSGNIIFDPMSSMTRTLAMACAIKGGKEIAIIGHTDCLVCKTTTMQLLERFKELGVERQMLPDNINEFFGMFSSERQNVIKGCDIVRHSPLIGPKIPVHGLLVDVTTGKLEWIVNGYEAWQRPASPVKNNFATMAGSSTEELGAGAMTGFNFGEMRFPESKIGEPVTKIDLAEFKPLIVPDLAVPVQPASAAPMRPPKISLPPPIRPRLNVQRDRR